MSKHAEYRQPGLLGTRQNFEIVKNFDEKKKEEKWYEEKK